MSSIEQKAKTLKVGVVPWQLWIKSPAYLKLTSDKIPLIQIPSKFDGSKLWIEFSKDWEAWRE